MAAAGDDVEHASHSNRYRDAQFIAVQVDPTLLLGMPECDQQHIRTGVCDARKNIGVVHVLHGSPRRLVCAGDDQARVELAKSSSCRLPDPVFAAEQKNPSATLRCMA
jgi:hypothetical protein